MQRRTGWCQGTSLLVPKERRQIQGFSPGTEFPQRLKLCLTDCGDGWRKRACRRLKAGSGNQRASSNANLKVRSTRVLVWRSDRDDLARLRPRQRQRRAPSALPFPLRYNQRFGMSIPTSQAASGARLGSYRGADTPATYGDTAAEFRALLQGSALFDLSWQGKLVLSGEDRVRWLNGMVTNNIRDLALNHGVYSFLLNAQGRNQGDLVAYNRGDYLLVTTDRAQAPVIAEIFERYIIMDDVEVAEISDKLGAVGVAGPNAREVLTAAGIDVSQLEAGQVIDTVWRELGISIARSVQPQMDGYEIWVASENVEKVWDALVQAGATPVGSDALELYRIARGVPRFGVDLARARSAAGDRPAACLEFQQGLLHRAGNCGAHSLPRQRASCFYRIRSSGRAASAGHEGSR